MSLIVAKDLTRSFGVGEAERRAVDGVSLEVDTGEILLIFGPSGCGKSTLLSIVGGLDRSFAGTLSLFGRDVAALPDAELSRLRGRTHRGGVPGWERVETPAELAAVPVPSQ